MITWLMRRLRIRHVTLWTKWGPGAQEPVELATFWCHFPVYKDDEIEYRDRVHTVTQVYYRIEDNELEVTLDVFPLKEESDG